MKLVNFLITITIAILSLTLWAYTNRPEQEPPWPARIQGFSFSPLHKEHDAVAGIFPAPEQIDADLALLAGKTHAVRSYTMEGPFPELPALAAKHNINVALGAWISDDLEKNEEQIQSLLEVAPHHRNVVRVIVGNETVLRGDIPVARLIDYLDLVRDKLQRPVSTAEPWHVWLKHPELVPHVDYLAVHMLPYWEGVDVDQAVDYIVDKMETLKRAFPGKPIVITEVGWPSNGRTRKAAVASEANEATFLRRFLDRAEKEGYIYYVMEAFDQPWKHQTEGAVGAYWGVYSVDRLPKFELTAPIVPIPHWQVLAGISVIVAMITLTLMFADSHTLRARGRGFLAVIAFAATTTGVWIVYEYTRQYMTVGSVIIGLLLLVGMMGVLLVLLTEAHEWAEAHWVTGRRRALKPVPAADEELPMVSIHVPAYNEPPAMLIETLNALAELDYPRFEVIVVDNNTKDPAVWQPVQAHCEKLGPCFRFYHVDPLGGFKAGALNFALRHTHPEAAVIGVIDSDYLVHRHWLRDLVPQFSREKTAIVQAPQDYRDANDNAFKAVCYAEYAGFFYIGMVTRNERNSIIQHGTMTLVRRTVLDEVGGWAEWCITEDADLGLRVFEAGHEALYVPLSYGRGLMPDNFLDYKKQRFRWAYGAIQILRHHLGVLSGATKSRLTAGQRYHFVAGWMPWIADAINLLFVFAALGWSLGMIYAPQKIDPPLVLFSILPLSLFSFKVAKMLYLYLTQVKANVRQTLVAALAGLAVSHTIAVAVFTGFLTRERPFFRTPKMANTQALLRAFAVAREELLLMIALWLAAYGVTRPGQEAGLDLMLWITMLLVLSLPYFAAVCLSLLSSLPGLPAGLIGKMPMKPPADREHALRDTARSVCKSPVPR